MKDKKKMAVLGILVFVCVGVGAFQFVSMSAPAPKPEATAKTDPKTDDATKTEGETAKNETGDGTTTDGQATNAEQADPTKALYAMALPIRDPFTEGRLPVADPTATPPTPAPVTQTTPPPAAGNHRPSGRRPGGGSGPTIPPMPVLPGDLSSSNGGEISLPNASGPATAPEDPSGGYSVSGVIQGAKNSAVISDSQGQQHLVHEGQSLDGDTKVVSVKNGKVTVKRKGKTITLSVGGNP